MSLLGTFRQRSLWLQCFLVLPLAPLIMNTDVLARESERVSRFGEYKGYSTEIYDSWVRTSQYLTMRDGIKLAADTIRPAKKGKVAEESLPVLWSHTRYRRAVIDKEGTLRSMADSPLGQLLLKHGYVLAAVDVRGAGASFGTYMGAFTREETQDAYEITEWLASQPWCDGHVGMIGGSYLGVTQLMAASAKPPHLKAIFPMVALFDIYSLVYHGGVYLDDFLKTWSDLTRVLDTEKTAAPVDADNDETLLKAAIAAHRSNRSVYEMFSTLKFRDSRENSTAARLYYEWHPAALIEKINQSGVSMYLWCGWFDSFTRDGFLMFRNFTAPRKLVIGAWSHAPRDPEIARDSAIAAIEHLRWFDYWLKGIDNGIMDEMPITYHVMKAVKDNEWRTARQWPLPGEQPTQYYFHKGPSGSVNSTNDGKLSVEMPQTSSGKDDYIVNYTTSSGQETRWDNAVGGGFSYPDLTKNDEKGLTYTTETLMEDVEITGHPVVHLWVSSTATDGDFFVYLEEVDSEGFSHYISEGTLRASHRALHQPPYDNLGLPYHRSHEEDVIDLIPGEPVELIFDLQPTSNIFDAGHHIRLTITCADKDNALTPDLSPPPLVSVFRNADHASYVLLPVIRPEAEGVSYFLIIICIVLGIVVLTIIFASFMRRRTSS